MFYSSLPPGSTLGSRCGTNASSARLQQTQRLRAGAGNLSRESGTRPCSGNGLPVTSAHWEPVDLCFRSSRRSRQLVAWYEQSLQLRVLEISISGVKCFKTDEKCRLSLVIYMTIVAADSMNAPC
jgi:hypothetical protein